MGESNIRVRCCTQNKRCSKRPARTKPTPLQQEYLEKFWRSPRLQPTNIVLTGSSYKEIVSHREPFQASCCCADIHGFLVGFNRRKMKLLKEHLQARDCRAIKCWVLLEDTPKSVKAYKYRGLEETKEMQRGCKCFNSSP